MKEVDQDHEMYSMGMSQDNMDRPFKQGKFGKPMYGNPMYGNPWGQGHYWKGGYGPYYPAQYGIPPWIWLLALSGRGPGYMEDNMYDPYNRDMY